MRLPYGEKVIIQARMESTRLPGKILKLILGQPMILLMLDRLCQVFTPDDLLVATAATVANQMELAPLLEQHGYRCVAPAVAPDDVLRRYAAIVQAERLDTAIRLTGDCPLIDPGVVLAMLTAFQERKPRLDYLAMASEWGDGLDIEVIAAPALLAADLEATDTVDREHVTPFLWKHPERFPQATWPCPLDLSAQKWSVDSEEDLAVVEAVYEAMDGAAWGWRDVYWTIMRHPATFDIPEWTRRRRNEGYMKQVGAEDWKSLRYGSTYAQRQGIKELVTKL